MPRRLIGACLLLAALGAGEVDAQVTGFRWVDERGNAHYAARRDQVPERYRSQLGPSRPGDPATPRLTPNPTGRVGTPRGCILRLRGTEKQRGSSHAYAHCDACREALHALGREDAGRAECFASSLADELGKGSR